MATVIDALIVTLGLDASKFTAGQKQAATAMLQTSAQATKTAKELEARGAQAANFFKKMRDQVIALTTAYLSLAAIKRFSEQMTQLDATLGRAAKNIGINKQELAAWQKVGERTGSTASEVTGAFEKISAELAQMDISGSSQLVPFLQQIGLSFEAFKQADPSERMLMISKALTTLGEGATRQKALQIGRGIFSEGILNMLMEGPGKINALLPRMRELSAAEAADTEAAIERHNAWLDFTETLTETFVPVLTQITPILKAILTDISEWVKNNKEWIKTGIVGAMGWLREHLHAVSLTLGVVMGLFVLSKFAGFATALLGTASAFEALAVSLAPFVAGAAIAVALAFVLDKIHDAAGFGNKDGFVPLPGGPAAGVPPPPPGVKRGEGTRPAGVAPMPGDSDFRVMPPAGPQRPVSDALAGLADSAMGKLIARGESGKADYNAVNRGASGGYAAGMENLVNMTVAEVQAAQAAHKFNAAGRYQIIGTTMAAAVKAMGLTGGEKFDKPMQDRIFSQYLVGAKRREIGDYINGRSNDLGAALLGGAKEWASIADPRTGLSYYGGVGNNKASISAEQFGRALRDAREMQRGAVPVFGANQPAAGASTQVAFNGPITVNDARDADHTAKSLKAGLRKHFAYANRANYGLA